MACTAASSETPRRRPRSKKRGLQPPRRFELDGTLAEAYNAMAFVQMQADYQWGAAEKTFLRAIELDTQFGPQLHDCYALELAALGRNGEAVAEIAIASD